MYAEEPQRVHGEFTVTGLGGTQTVRGEGRRDQDRGAFGTVSQLPSGRWRALYYGPEGKAGRRYKAPCTFRTKGEARKFLATVHADIIRNQWLPPVEQAPAPTKQTLADYADIWLPNRLIDGEPLKDRTRHMYREMLDTPVAYKGRVA
jgi:hypothetical protein